MVLLELCCEQRAEHGGLSAETTRAAIAKRAGLTVDRLDHCNQILERAGVVSIERRRAPNGGRHLPSTYTMHEAPQPAIQDGQAGHRQGGGPVPAGRRYEYWQGGEPVPAGRRYGYRQGGESVLGRAANGYRQGGDPVLAGRRSGYWQGGFAATLGTGFAALYRARGRAGCRKGSRNPSPSVLLRKKRRGEGLI